MEERSLLSDSRKSRSEMNEEDTRIVLYTIVKKKERKRVMKSFMISTIDDSL